MSDTSKLTVDDLKVLKRAFPRASHEFLRGFVYIREDAITDRLEEVDPAWSFEIVNIEHTTDNAIAYGRMTIKGIMRDGIGMQKVNEKAGEAAKGAATDALKRCARLFGVGRYLLDAPNEGENFDRWLAQQQKGASSAERPTQPALSSSASTAPTPANGASGDRLYAIVNGISWHDKQDGKGTYYRLHAKDEANGADVVLVAFNKTALDLLGFDYKALKEKEKVDYGYDTRVPYSVEQANGKSFNSLDDAEILLSQQWTGEPT